MAVIFQRKAFRGRKFVKSLYRALHDPTEIARQKRASLAQYTEDTLFVNLSQYHLIVTLKELAVCGLLSAIEVSLDLGLSDSSLRSE